MPNYSHCHHHYHGTMPRHSTVVEYWNESLVRKNAPVSKSEWQQSHTVTLNKSISFTQSVGGSMLEKGGITKRNFAGLYNYSL